MPRESVLDLGKVWPYVGLFFDRSVRVLPVAVGGVVKVSRALSFVRSFVCLFVTQTKW